MNQDNAFSGTPFDLTGKTAVITGGSGLLGAEFAKALVSARASVIIGDINNDNLSKTKNEINKLYKDSNVSAIHLNVNNSQSIIDFIAQIEKEHGKVDILVNSAAINPKFEKGSELSEFRRFEIFHLLLGMSQLISI